MAALCHVYPGYTLESLCGLPQWQLSVLISVANEIKTGEKDVDFDADPDEVDALWTG